jgi:hypothetical protein
MTKMDAIKAWLAERHPELHLTEGEGVGSTYCLIGKNTNLDLLVNRAIHKGQDAQVVEIDFNRKSGVDWFFSYHDYKNGTQGFTPANISNPNYFTQLENMLNRAGLNGK